MRLQLLEGRLSVCRLVAAEPIPDWANEAGGFVSITRTQEELSIVCAETAVPRDVQREDGWRAFRVEGSLDFALVGILASIAEPLARAGISIFAVSTFNTDYVLVKEANVEAAAQALERAGHRLA